MSKGQKKEDIFESYTPYSAVKTKADTTRTSKKNVRGKDEKNKKT